MKILLRLVGIVVVLLVLVGGGLQLASETGEVVTLTTLDDAGEPATTRLWVVEIDGYQYLRSGDAGSGWYQRLLANPNVTVERNGQEADYTAVPDTTKVEEVNRLMAEKYGFSDTYISTVLGDRSSSIAIRLEPKEAP